LHYKKSALKEGLHKLSGFPKNKMGKILGYDNDHLKMPNKIIEMGLLPETFSGFCIRLRSMGRCMWNLEQRKAGLLFVRKKEIISLLKN
jgi:hypothetical protein